MLTVQLASPLWAEHKFNCGITGSRYVENINDDVQSGLQSMSTTNENFDAVKKMILDYPRRITIREVADNVGILFG